ncbi:MAG TPA: hypothetical protein P5063_04180 [Methanomassiliicoccales archaeon]|jgi:hypothetical protein|nr:hypothetical protein [Methanomassiliicoccales archaeon]
MVEEQGERPACLWHAPDGRCANCKARRFRLDALGMKDTYGECRGQIDYHTCEFYKARPAPKG